ncbi:conserved hypothetical protein [Aspergillus terreus NIH2624]|uniref:Intracellular protein transport protein n=1 Tax=Aspergillus terreus (strain NIH 2624 / FGSC A1156) TaxID=341663 RepID=Q0CYR4_ASPTN|nr:uncharacterized protein ATEG_01170 [Aspergillus terreus NIH2624]EAU37927.1 conserved hypothetical protein [Aspergillus terreus NIH2624]
MPSDIQVFVKWKDQTIFAGEDVECTITFKNVAEQTAETNNGGQLPHQRKQSRTGNTSPKSESLFSLRSPQSLFFNSHRRSYPTLAKRSPAHRISSSVSSPLIGSHSFPPPSTPRSGPPAGHKHKRSVSILSIDSDLPTDITPRSSSQFSRSKPVRGHGRSASLQVPPRRHEGYEEPFGKGRTPSRGYPPESPIAPSSNGLRLDMEGMSRGSRPGSAAHSPIRPMESPRAARRPALPPIDFKFPASPTTESSTYRPSTSPLLADGNGGAAVSSKLNDRDPSSLAPAQVPQLTKIMSTSSLSGSHKSSGEFYSVGNGSSETLQSEYTNYSIPVPRSNAARHSRHMSSLEPSGRSINSQALLMGYAQISASFTVDGSLINQSAFEDVKRKGVVGGQGSMGTPNGNPASRNEKSRKGGGFWGAFKWNAIEESLSGFLSNNDLDGLREMRGVSSSRSIPLLSTPQSLLFVDLRLAPGEEQSYSFSFTLPSGLPASHKGKAIKISYNLVIGTQRPSSVNEPQRVNRISIPFRVFSGVNGQGEILGHNLMNPYVLLRDEARVQKVGSSLPPSSKPKSISVPTWTSAPEFLSYVDELLEKHSRSALLQPPDVLTDKQPSHDVSTGPLTCKDAIDLAILRSNQAPNASHSPNRFEIARNGRRIAVVVLNRPAHRLGETIIATVDFTDTALPCYAIRATLETSERVAGSLAVRSGASIRRATRRVHASFFENTLYSTRVVFSPAVPISATPTILTNGVNHEWELRFEFVTPTVYYETGTGPSGAQLLEAVHEDDRGQILTALENLGCESFEISIPITVYGETVRERVPEEDEGYSI